jgi:hypothetical protein
MKRIPHAGFPTVLMALAFVLTFAAAPGADESEVRTVLQIHVTIPPTPSPTAERDVGERFVDALDDTFRQRGFTGKVVRIDDLDKLKEGEPVVRINLVDWSRDHAGNINCRFSAVLETGGTKKELGSFDGMSPGLIAGPGRFGASRAFDDAAQTADRDLFDALAKTELIVGLRRR